MTLEDRLTTSTTRPTPTQQRDYLPLVLVQSLLILLLFANVLQRAVNRPEWFDAFYFNLLYVAFAPLILFAYGYYRKDKNLWLHVAQLALLVLITLALLRQENKYIPPAGEGRFVHVTLLYLCYLAYPLLGYDLVEFLRDRAVYVGAYATVLGAYFYHVYKMPAGSGHVSFVVFVGLLFGMNLFFIPRHVSRDVFLWGASLASSFAVGLGMLSYVIGEYKLSWFRVTWFGLQYRVPLVGAKFHYMQSIFENPNTLGMLAFAGAFAALVLAGEAARRRSFLVAPIAGGLFLLNGFGLYATHSRASWLAMGLASVVYVAYAVFDRRIAAYTTVGVGALAVLFLVGMFLSIVPIAPHGRFALWEGGLRAVLHAPSPLGYGVVAEDKIIAPYVPIEHFKGFSPHNSYSVIFINVGIVGGLAYLVLMLGSIVEGVFRYESVDMPMLAFGFGFAFHHLFEQYTMFSIDIGSILAALVFGYLIVGYRRRFP